MTRAGSGYRWRGKDEDIDSPSGHLAVTHHDEVSDGFCLL